MEITWLDVIKILIPVVAVILAGGMALYNLRHSIKLQAKNKWKEDFRNYVSDYIETYMTALYGTTIYKMQGKDGLTANAPNVSASLSQLTGKCIKIQMMLNKKSKDYEDFNAIATYHFNKLEKILQGDKKAEDIEDTLKDFYEVAKRIYDKK